MIRNHSLNNGVFSKSERLGSKIINRFRIMLLVGLLPFQFSCGNEKEWIATDQAVITIPQGWDKVINVENTNLMIDIPAVNIQTGQDNDHSIILTMLKSNLREGFEDQAVRRNATGRMIATIRSGQSTYTEMTDRDSYFRIKILRLEKQKNEAEIRIEARLVDTDTNSRYFEVKTIAYIHGEQFKTLIE